MRKQEASTLISSVLAYLLLCVGSAGGLVWQKRCSSSCGQTQDIRYPFRLKTDPETCGDKRYELTCDGNNNNTILDYYSGKYYVKFIDYSREIIQVTDVGLASGLCGFPSHTLSPENISHNGGLRYDSGYNTFFYSGYYAGFNSGSWTSFINCTKKIPIHGNQNLLYVPCLSRNNTFVYVVFDEKMRSLAPSCRLLYLVPSMSMLTTNTEAGVFKQLQNGFQLSWANQICLPVSQAIHYCFLDFRYDMKYTNDLGRMMNALVRMMNAFLFESIFFDCLQRTTCYSYGTYWVALVLAVLNQVLVLLVLARLLVRLIMAPLIVFAYLGYEFWKARVPIDEVEKFLQNQQSLAPKRYAYTDIIAMTRHFKEKLGQGGFGSVYKGELPGGFQVAVKMLGNSKCNGDEFISEVSTIGTIHHVNVVRLVGFSSEGSKRALVYEYLPKGSLEKYIFSSGSSSTQRPFTWDKLNEIALGVARGIDYLHGGCDMRILHFDIKPHNILLDNGFNPKVSDFGLAKLYPKDYSMVSMSAARGTVGYIAPELISRSFGVVSYKSDVYSFGMLLLEMAGGRRNVEPKAQNTSQIYYPSWIFDQLSQREMHDIVNFTPIGEAERKLCIVGLWCIQTRPANRPSMSKVVEMLEADVATLRMPPKPFLSSTPSVSVRESSIEPSSSGLSIISEHENLV